jgi:hypothetical protein
VVLVMVVAFGDRDGLLEWREFRAEWTDDADGGWSWDCPTCA